MRKSEVLPYPVVTPQSISSYRNILLLLLVIILSGISHSAVAQEEIVNHTTLLIAEGKYSDGEKYLDSILARDSRNVTALMMKGNVVLNYALMQSPNMQQITPDDESIFTKDLSTLENHVAIIPRPAALKIEQLWKQALLIDSSRLDIRKGLCSLYGMALMHDELIRYLPVMVHAASDKGSEFAYTLVEYAKLLHERGDTTGAYATYRRVSELYPTVSGVYCEMAESYFTDGDIVRTNEAARQGITMVNADIAGCHNAIEIYTATGGPTEVLRILKIAAKDTSYKDYPFYKALYKYTFDEGTFSYDIKEYLSQPHFVKDSSGVYGAAQYMSSKSFTLNYKSMMTLLNYNISDFGSKLLIRRLVADYKDSIAPYLIAVPVLLNDKNYNEASALLQVLYEMVPDESNILYYYGYSEYCAGHYEKAIQMWSRYVEVKKKTNAPKVAMDGYLATPYYFLGQSHLKSGDKSKAKEYFELILAGKDESKYAYMAKVTLDRMR